MAVFTSENIADIPSATPLFLGAESEKLCGGIYIDESIVRKKLDRIRADKALTVYFSESFLVLLTMITKCSLESGVVPDDRKAANVTVTPIHKNGFRSHASSHICKKNVPHETKKT